MSFNKLNAQEDSAFNKLLQSINLDELFGTETSTTKTSVLKFQSSYLSNYVYGGRKDTSTTYPYFTPSLQYLHKSGLFANANFSFLTNNNSRLDVTSLIVGYSKNNIVNHFDLGLYASKSFYNASSTNVQSDVKWNTGLNIGYLKNNFYFSATPSLMIGSQTDFALNFSLQKQITIKETQKYSVTFSPNFSAYFGSTGFYQTTKVSGIRNNTLPQQKQTLTITSPEKFQMLSYEFSLPIYFDKEKWGIYFLPTLALPVSAITTTYKLTDANGNLIPATPNKPNPITSKEVLTNSFFTEFGFYYKF